jgi:hypothetical protein
MPRTPVPVTTVTRAGIAPAAEVNGDSANNHSVVNDGKMTLEVRNAHATIAKTVTVKFTTTVDDQIVTSRVYSIPATVTRRIGPWPTQWYGQSLQVDVESADIKLTAYTPGP